MRGKTRESGIVQRLRRSLAEVPCSTPPRVLVGFSGGADSLALLAALRELERLGLLDLTALHVDHGVRDTSATEAATVVEVASALGATCETWTVAPADLARHQGVGVEEALRRERYRAFATTSARLGADLITTAHHQRDQAETVLLHLLRGAGLGGVSGMRPLSALTVPWWHEQGEPRTIRMWRPLLDEPVETIREFAERQKLPIIEDASNRESIYRRNAIRNDLVPMLEHIAPGAVANIANFAKLAADDNEALSTLAAAFLSATATTESLRLDTITNQPVALQRRLLRQWVLAQAPRLELSSQRIDALRIACLHGDGGKRIQLGEGWLGIIRHGTLQLERET